MSQLSYDYHSRTRNPGERAERAQGLSQNANKNVTVPIAPISGIALHLLKIINVDGMLQQGNSLRATSRLPQNLRQALF